jgi:hypothetical protein
MAVKRVVNILNYALGGSLHRFLQFLE